jgi:adenosylcobinamide kinase / adenosylcobinamide-phosphate guanylyltransferase
MITLILGGARSGKSDLAVKLADDSGGAVLVLATMQPADDEMHARVAAHRASRPEGWRTVEEPLDLAGALRAHARPGDFVLIDCITLWVSNLLLASVPDADAISTNDATVAVAGVGVAIDGLLSWAAQFNGEAVIVSNEVGLGLVPPYPLGRLFRDALGLANQMLAEHADRVAYVVAGLVLDLHALGAVPIARFGEARGA